MYISRLSFSTVPGKGREAAEALKVLARLIVETGGAPPRILRTQFASLGEADIQLEQAVDSLGALESQIGMVASHPEFQRWSQEFSPLLNRSPKREIFEVAGEG
ncbi:MAG: hypothetical protein U0556_14465 [Dehalococcoidia bacterium]